MEASGVGAEGSELGGCGASSVAMGSEGFCPVLKYESDLYRKENFGWEYHGNSLTKPPLDALREGIKGLNIEPFVQQAIQSVHPLAHARGD